MTNMLGVPRPPKYTPEEIDAALFEVALHGGNVRRARLSLVDRATGALELAAERDEQLSLPDLPSEAQIGRWLAGPYKDRYAEILKLRQDALDEHLAAQATITAIAIEDAKMKALKETLNGLGAANGVEASMILRNLTQAQAQSQGIAATVRGGQRYEERTETLGELARSLDRLGKGAITVSFEEDNTVPDELVEAIPAG